MPSNYLFLVSLAQIFGKFAFCLSSFSGFILIFLTVFGVRQIFGTYKYLMIIFTSLGIFLAGLEMIVHPNLHFYNNGFVYFTLSRPFDMGKDNLKILLASYTGLYAITICLLAVQFIYRYWALFGLQYLRYFEGWQILIWIFYCLFFGGLSLSAYVLWQIDDTSKTYFEKEMHLRYDVVLEDLPTLAFLAFDPKTGDIRWWNLSYTIILTTFMGLQYGIMMYCGWKMYSKMEEKIKNLSVALQHLNRQLFKTLVMQITAPTIFLFSPLVIIVFLPFFQVELSFPAGAIICAFSFYPAMDSCIVFLIVTEYRMAVKGLWTTILRKLNLCKKPANPRNTIHSEQISLSVMRAPNS